MCMNGLIDESAVGRLPADYCTITRRISFPISPFRQAIPLPSFRTVPLLLLRTLGGLSLQVDAQPGTGAAGQRARLALLAAIAAAGDQGISRDRLYPLFWSERDAEHSRGSLNQALFSLRRDTGASELILGITELRLNPEVIRSDVGDFERAMNAEQWETAFELYAGPFLDGVYLRDALEFERWAGEQRARLQGRYHTTLERLAAAAAARNDPSAAVSWWHQRANSDPLDGVVALAFMKALIAAGDSAGAIRHARVYGELVRQELNAAPDPAIATLMDLIQRNGQSLPYGRSSDAPVAESEIQPVAGPAAPRHLSMWRWGLAAALLLVVAGAGAWLATHRPLDPSHVAVRILPGLRGDDLDAMLNTELADGLARLGLVVVRVADAPRPASRFAFTPGELRSIARAARARYVVTAGQASDGDSLVFRAQLADGDAVVPIGSIEPVYARREGAKQAIETLLSRVMATLSARTDPKLARWAYAAAMPTTFESVRELRLGIDAWAGENSARAGEHFLKAAALDSTSATPLVWNAFRLATDQKYAAADSQIATLSNSPRRLGAWDHGLIDVLTAWIRADLVTSLAAGKNLMRVVPNSEWALIVAYDAVGLGRAGQAVRMLRSLDPDMGWLEGGHWYWNILGVSYHLLGDYHGELATANAALARNPDDRRFVQIKVKALAGLGRVSEAKADCTRTLSLRAQTDWSYQPCGQLIYELWAHGFPKEARRVADAMIAHDTVVSGLTDVVRRTDLADAYASVRDYAAAERALGTIPPADLAKRVDPDLLATLAAARGDRTAVARWLAAGDSAASGPIRSTSTRSYVRARIAALLGEQDNAITWLNRAFEEGFRFHTALHLEPEFDRLRGYPPFEALAHSVDRP